MSDRAREVGRIVESIDFPGYTFLLGTKQNFNPEIVTVRVSYDEKDVMSGVKETQFGRRWIIEPEATDMAIIQTCFKALLTSLEHRAREHFTYQGKAILQPHFDLEKLLAIAPGRTEHAPDPIPFEGRGPK